MVNVHEKIDTIRFRRARNSHISIDQKKCAFCQTKPCLIACPAGMFTLSEEEEVLYSYEGCLECGTCYVVCPSKSINWNYPKGGCGVSYRES